MRGLIDDSGTLAIILVTAFIVALVIILGVAAHYGSINRPTYSAEITGNQVFDQVDGEMTPPRVPECWMETPDSYDSDIYIEIKEPLDADWNIRSIYIYDQNTGELACVTEIEPQDRFVHIGLTTGYYRMELVTWDGRVADEAYAAVSSYQGVARE